MRPLPLLPLRRHALTFSVRYTSMAGHTRYNVALNTINTQLYWTYLHPVATRDNVNQDSIFTRTLISLLATKPTISIISFPTSIIKKSYSPSKESLKR